MKYQPNKYDAEAVYALAAQHLHNSDGNMSVDQPPISVVEEIEQHHWQINDPNERAAALAVCTYNEATERWTVKIGQDEVPVQVAWNEDETNWQFLIP